MKKVNLIFTLLIIGSIFSFAQIRIENWKSITSLNNVNTADLDSQGRIWAGCYGGVFVFNPKDSSYKNFRNIEGLISLDISIIKFDQTRKQMIIGTSDGIIELMDENFKITHITDIKSSRFPNPVINDILISNDFAYIAGGFGITKFDLKNQVFLESIFRFGTFSENTSARDIHIFDNELWVATEFGIAKVSLNKEITNPDNWINFTTKDGLTENDAYSISDFQNEVYFTTKNSIGKISPDSIQTIKTAAAWETLQKFYKFNGELYYTNGFSVTSVTGIAVDFKQFININGFGFIPSNGSLLVFIKDKGIGNFTNGEMNYYYPNTPSSNLFQSTSLDPSGNLWSATDISPRGRGYAKFDGTNWKIFNTEKYPELKNNNYYLINAISDNKILLSNWGIGYTIMTGFENNYRFDIYDTTNSPFVGIADARAYIISGGSVLDSKGTIWTVNYGENSSGPQLVALDKNNNFHSYTNQTVARRRFYRSIVIDMNGTKWLGSTNGDGLLYYNENNSLENTLDDKTGIFDSYNSGLYDETQNCLALDNDGFVWVGTNEGLNCIINPSSVLTGQNTIIRKITVLGNRVINSIYIDALNYKWVGTNEGIWILSPDATEVIKNINTSNSYLLSEQIISINSNTKTGEFYIGSRKGLNIIQTTQIKPDENYNITAHPQPFVINRDKELVIEGLAINSDVRILTLDGNLIRKLSAEGKVIVWDGKTDSGENAPSGVYLISARSMTTENMSYGKIAVINK